MDKLIYVAMSGAKQIEMSTMVNNHNLANINTPGFRADLTNAISREKTGQGFETRVYAGNGDTSIDMAQGTIVTSGRELDIAINGEGFIAVQNAEGGEAYTRRGDLRLDGNGFLMTGDGSRVMGNGGPIVIPPAEKIEIASDGTISIRPTGQAANALTVLDRIRLVKVEPENLAKSEDGLMIRRDGQPAEVDSTIRVISGSIEKSNVNTIETVVNMITLSRAYETQINLIRKATEMDTSTAETVRLT